MTHIEKMRLQAALKAASGECSLPHPAAPRNSLRSFRFLLQRERQGRSEVLEERVYLLIAQVLNVVA
eukprot:COSAG04_NODE_1986_length_5067_cov_2.041667_3_plen_67_part_00